MSYNVIWSNSSKNEFAELLEYVESNFDTDAALKLLEKTERVVIQISLYPEMFPSSELKAIRKATITKQTSLIYKIEDNRVLILHFWDNRQNPEKV